MTTALKESEIEQRCALRVLLERREHKVHGCGGMSGQFRVSFGSFSFSRVFFWSRCNPLPSPPRKRGPVTTGVYWIRFRGDDGPQNAADDLDADGQGGGEAGWST